MGVYGHGQFCHSVSHVQTERSLGLVDASFRGVREQWLRHTCGLYALMFLIHMSVGGTLDTFMNIFSRHDFVKNDRRVAQLFQHLVERDMTWHRVKQFRQTNHVPVRLLDMVMLQ